MFLFVNWRCAQRVCGDCDETTRNLRLFRCWSVGPRIGDIRHRWTTYKNDRLHDMNGAYETAQIVYTLWSSRVRVFVCLLFFFFFNFIRSHISGESLLTSDYKIEEVNRKICAKEFFYIYTVPYDIYWNIDIRHTDTDQCKCLWYNTAIQQTKWSKMMVQIIIIILWKITIVPINTNNLYP